MKRAFWIWRDGLKAKKACWLEGLCVEYVNREGHLGNG